MREIKFRAWVVNGKAMADWKTITKECDRLSLLKDDNFIFMQFTGLTDKNGVEIYEGDILSMWYAPQATCKGIVSFDNGSFIFTTKQATPPECRLGDIESFGNYIEVIGNIFENKELIDNS